MDWFDAAQSVVVTIVCTLSGSLSIYVARKDRNDLAEPLCTANTLGDYSIAATLFGVASLHFVRVAIPVRHMSAVGKSFAIHLTIGILLFLIVTILANYKTALWNSKSPRAQRLKALREAGFAKGRAKS